MSLFYETYILHICMTNNCSIVINMQREIKPLKNSPQKMKTSEVTGGKSEDSQASG